MQQGAKFTSARSPKFGYHPGFAFAPVPAPPALTCFHAWLIVTHTHTHTHSVPPSLVIYLLRCSEADKLQEAQQQDEAALAVLGDEGEAGPGGSGRGTAHLLHRVDERINTVFLINSAGIIQMANKVSSGGGGVRALGRGLGVRRCRGLGQANARSRSRLEPGRC